MKFSLLGLLVVFSSLRTNEASSFDGLTKRPPWGSGLSVAELNSLRLEHGWLQTPDVRVDGIQFVTRIRGLIYKSHSATTMLTYLRMQMW